MRAITRTSLAACPSTHSFLHREFSRWIGGKMKPRCLSLILLSCLCFPWAALATNAPSNLAATGASSNQVNLTWTDNSNNEIGFTFAYDTNSGLTSPDYTYAGGANTASYSHTGRSPATTYYYKVKAEGNPDSAWTPVDSATTAPAGLTLQATSNSAISLNWTGNGSNSAIIGYTHAYATNSSFTGATYKYVDGNGSTSTSRTGLSTATTYWFKIKAEGTSDALDSPFGAVTATTTTPASLAASVVSNSQINLSWAGNAGNTNIVGYTIAHATNSSFSGATYRFVAGAGATSFNHTGLSAGTAYYYKIKAEGTSDLYDSAFTSSIPATTPGGGTTPSSSAVPISAHFAGINAWMPSYIGSHFYNGKLGMKWNEVEASGVKIMRYGGNGVDQYANPSDPATLAQYVDLVDAMRSRGIEPVLQVPVYGWTYNTSQAKAIVRHVNITNSRGVKYWSIGNEPDLASGVYQYTSAAQVAGYIKPFASAMKEVDPTIKILGPETAWYNTGIINGLTSCTGDPAADANSIAGKDPSGHYYVDIISFHNYNNFAGNQTRSQVITELMSAGGLNEDLGALRDRLDDCNTYHGRTGEYALKMAVTETNVNHHQPDVDGIGGVGAASFIGGQFWAEVMGVAMRHGVDFVTFWSVIEGGSSHRASEIGYISGDGATLRPSYYHFQMVAQSFRGSSVAATDTRDNVKAFGALDVDQIAVIILNQEPTDGFDYNYTVRLNTAPVSGTNPLKINVDAGLAVEYSGTISRESSIVLIFDASGVLKKKIEYKRSVHADSGLPPAVTNY